MAHQATLIVGGIALISPVLTSLVSIRMTRPIVRPIRDLTESAAAIRHGDFDCRVKVQSRDELGQLAEGFNRMAETLAEYRISSLAEFRVNLDVCVTKIANRREGRGAVGA